MNVFVAIPRSNADKWSSVSVTPNYMSSAYVFFNLCAPFMPLSLTPVPSVNATDLPSTGTTWMQSTSTPLYQVFLFFLPAILISFEITLKDSRLTTSFLTVFFKDNKIKINRTSHFVRFNEKLILLVSLTLLLYFWEKIGKYYMPKAPGLS